MEVFHCSEMEIRKISRDFGVKAIGSAALILFAVIVLAATYNGILLPEIDDPDVWFQRSGSVAVFIAVYLEYIAQFQLKNLAEFEIERITFDRPFSSYFELISQFCVGLAIIGTIVWGYGDLLYEYMHNNARQ